MSGSGRLFERLEKLYDVGLIGQATVLIAGCGSGGSQVALQLVMSGVRKFELYDNQQLGEENVIRHACGLRYVGQNKTDALADVLRDRNPGVNPNIHNEDLMRLSDIEDRVRIERRSAGNGQRAHSVSTQRGLCTYGYAFRCRSGFYAGDRW